jgi:rubrerythrin
VRFAIVRLPYIAGGDMNQEQLEQLLSEALETELGGVQIYDAALKCAQNEELREEWEKYREQTRDHVEILRNVCKQLGIDADKKTDGRRAVGRDRRRRSGDTGGTQGPS